jgi:hypothetical protein
MEGRRERWTRPREEEEQEAERTEERARKVMQSNAAVTSFTAFAYWFDMAFGHNMGVYPENLRARE